MGTYFPLTKLLCYYEALLARPYRMARSGGCHSLVLSVLYSVYQNLIIIFRLFSVFNSRYFCFLSHYPLHYLLQYYTNLVHGCTDFVHGYINIVHGYTNYVHGYTNLVHGCTNIVHGYTNLVHGCTNFVHILPGFYRVFLAFVE